MKFKIVISVIVAAALGGVILYIVSTRPNGVPASQEVTKPILTVSPQIPKEVVYINNVVMPEKGWLVARGIEDNRLGQVIEISPFLEKGEHKNIKIFLGEFYNNEELIVIIYADNGDNVFNDNDQPFKNVDGNFIARYVKNGEIVPMSMMQPDQNVGHVMGGENVKTVKYTNNGFEPSTIEISVGTPVHFINESNDVMWVASNDHPEHDMLPTFDQFGTTQKGGSYMYVFDKAGTWPYHDHINPEKEGVIKVQ